MFHIKDSHFLKWKTHKTGKLSVVFINRYTSELTEHFECIIQVLRETQASIIPNFRLRNQAYRGKWIAPHYRANECQSQVLQSFSHKIDCESHFILKVYQNICFTNRLLLCLFFFSTASLKCTHYSPRGFLAKKKKKIEAWNFWDFTNGV